MHYNVLAIAGVLIAAYTISFLLSRSGRLRPRIHRGIWNIILLVALLTTGLLGVLMALRRDLGINPQWPINIGFWHVETGIALSVVAIFHIGWHLGYFRDLLRRAAAAERDDQQPPH